MSNLLYYLNKMYQEFDDATLVETFSEKFGVKVQIEEHKDYSLYQFKYNMIEAKWSFPLVHECRGCILKFQDKKWEFKARPFDKFFNVGEGWCKLTERSTFDSLLSSMSFVEKADGTCIILWFNEHWRVSTLGKMNTTTTNVNGSNTYETLFYKTLLFTPEVNKKAEFLDHLDRDHTYIFELAAKENAIITQYNEDKVYLLGIRHNEKGFLMPQYTIDNFVEDMLNRFDLNINLNLPKKVLPHEYGITDLDSAREWVNGEGRVLLEKYKIVNPEGYVVYSGPYPVGKMKNASYLMLHTQFSGNDAHCLNSLIDNVFNETIDDVYEQLSDRNKLFVDKVKERVQYFKDDIMNVMKEVRTTYFETRKEYALFIQSRANPRLQGFFFEYYKEKDNIRSVPDFLWDWIKKNYTKHMDMWKD